MITGVGRLESPYLIQFSMLPGRSLRSKLKKELNGMEATEVIEKVEEPRTWVNSLVVVENPNGSLQLCLDQ